jgi:hypothetical protein
MMLNNSREWIIYVAGVRHNVHELLGVEPRIGRPEVTAVMVFAGTGRSETFLGDGDRMGWGVLRWMFYGDNFIPGNRDGCELAYIYNVPCRQRLMHGSGGGDSWRRCVRC